MKECHTKKNHRSSQKNLFFLFKVYLFECTIWVWDDGIQVGPQSIISDPILCWWAAIPALVTGRAVMLVLTYFSVHIVKSTQTCGKQTNMFSIEWIKLYLQKCSLRQSAGEDGELSLCWGSTWCGHPRGNTAQFWLWEVRAFTGQIWNA